jgi:hypothetical protein
MRDDDFLEAVKRKLAARVNNICSRPDCRAQTSGPQEDPGGSINVGVAAHITAASRGGPRYDETLPPAQRRSPENGIWLCQNCGKMVDSDRAEYTVELLKTWKADAEREAKEQLGKTRRVQTAGAAPDVTIGLRFTDQDKKPKVHHYRFFVALVNNGDTVITDWYLEVEFPLEFISPATEYGPRLRRDPQTQTAYFHEEGHKLREGLQRLLPGRATTLDFPYHVTEELCSRFSGKIDRPIKVLLYVRGRRAAVREVTFDEFQTFKAQSG